jgi:hypothetical protein
MKSIPLKIMLLGLLTLISVDQVSAFCGFYVAKGDLKLFNKTSQVIIVRDGDHTVITMSSDYQGDAKDFAMVVPVPEVLKESDIRVVQQYIFDKFDAFTSPRLVEYWDENPCGSYRYYNEAPTSAARSATKDLSMDDFAEDEKSLGVTIEAKYTVGEYDILILSAKESSGLKTWLVQNDYKIPSGADEVLQPYITDGMKFFVVKVNLEKQKSLGVQTLRPLQIQFNSSRFMLPIRLGMANSDGAAQDMIVYAFTRKGRVETANYRTTKLPTDREIPEFVMSEGLFPNFYKDMYGKAWANEGKNNVMLEYAWDESSQQSMHCDPCPTPPLTFAEIREAGVWWVEPDQYNGSYFGDLFITRLHVRYDRAHFPQDLMFLNTPDQSNFQGRYVIRHAATGDLNCAEGKRYKADLRMRHQKELLELAALTGWNVLKWSSYIGSADATESMTPTIPTVSDPTMQPRTSCPTCPIGAVTPDLRINGLAPVASPVSDADTNADRQASVTHPGLVNEPESLAVSEAFLKAGLADTPKPLMSKRMWLFSIAGLMFVGGFIVRMRGRKKSNPNAA